MYQKILVPVDLAHSERLDKAIGTASDLAKHYRTGLCFVGVTTTAPNEVARTPEEYSGKLQRFADEQGKVLGVAAESLALTSHDPAVDLSEKLLEAVEQSGADLVVMASHLPGLPEHLFASHGGHVAAHARVSVLLVR